ncbi:hypothetical protein B0H19DRAFT_1111510 [Mycena capillaripes]|nr:hypothetical protein B0H19DRAFT_1186491 [Mycena capillaripes]KAJ6586147.1 hypothetical protein B0H19DRAFT_1111510 [Mycena capillaripes]
MSFLPSLLSAVLKGTSSFVPYIKWPTNQLSEPLLAEQYLFVGAWSASCRILQTSSWLREYSSCQASRQSSSWGNTGTVDLMI